MSTVNGAPVVNEMEPIISYRDWLETFTAMTGGNPNEVVKMTSDQVEEKVEELFHFDFEQRVLRRKSSPPCA